MGNEILSMAQPNSSDASFTETVKSELISFYGNKENIDDRVFQIINRTSPLSLRILDYFAVNFARQQRVFYNVNNKPFDVYTSYKTNLEYFKKKRFDPFRRHSRIDLTYSEKDRIQTTIGQLCFFRWCLQNKVLDYVEKNINVITEDMKRYYLNRATEKIEGGKTRKSSRRRSNIHVSAIRTSNGNEKYIVTFD